MIDAEWTADLEMSLRIYEMQIANQLLHIRIDQARDIVRQALAVLRGRVQTLPVVLQMTPAAVCLADSIETLPTDLAIHTARTHQELREQLLKIYRTEKIFLERMKLIAHGIF